MRKAIALTLLTLLTFGCSDSADQKPVAKQKQEVEPSKVKPPCALGYCAGQTIEEDSRISDGFHFYEADSDIYSTLLVLHTPKAGVCKVTGSQGVPNPDNHGVKHRSVFSELTGKTVKKHGRPTLKLNHLRAGSAWKKPQYWLLGLHKKERVLQWVWELPRLRVEVEAYPSDIMLSYIFPNFAACKQEAEESIRQFSHLENPQ